MSYQFTLISECSDQLLEGFNCGDNELDKYLSKQARQDDSMNHCRVHILLYNEKIAGFYTLSNAGIDTKNAPSKYKRRTSYPQLPCLLLGRMATDEHCQGQGIGTLLLVDCVNRAYRMSCNDSAFSFLLVDSKKGKEGFYKKFGFNQLASTPQRLYLTYKQISSIGKATINDPKPLPKEATNILDNIVGNTER